MWTRVAESMEPRNPVPNFLPPPQYQPRAMTFFLAWENLISLISHCLVSGVKCPVSDVRCPLKKEEKYLDGASLWKSVIKGPTPSSFSTTQNNTSVQDTEVQFQNNCELLCVMLSYTVMEHSTYYTDLD